jgi:hypothetical protein
VFPDSVPEIPRCVETEQPRKDCLSDEFSILCPHRSPSNHCFFQASHHAFGRTFYQIHPAIHITTFAVRQK